MSSASSSSPTSPTRSTALNCAWQTKLQETCRARNIPEPQFYLVSDRRGGRTAWSANVVIILAGVAWRIHARYWYDGEYLDNAKEDAAEVALTVMQKPPDMIQHPPVMQLAQQPITYPVSYGTTH